MGEEAEQRWHADNNEPKLRLGKVLPCVLDIENASQLPRAQVSVLKLFVRIRVQVLRQLQIAVGVDPQNQDQRASSEEDSRGKRTKCCTSATVSTWDNE